MALGPFLNSSDDFIYCRGKWYTTYYVHQFFIIKLTRGEAKIWPYWKVESQRLISIPILTGILDVKIQIILDCCRETF